MIKNGWNLNVLLNRNDLEFIGEVNNCGNMFNINLIYIINIFSNCLGYYVILVVWDVVDIDNVFYNVIDVNV